jgi:hypothetical protein
MITPSLCHFENYADSKICDMEGGFLFANRGGFRLRGTSKDAFGPGDSEISFAGFEFLGRLRTSGFVYPFRDATHQFPLRVNDAIGSGSLSLDCDPLDEQGRRKSRFATSAIA